MAIEIIFSLVLTKYSESLLHRRYRSSPANVRSTIHPFGIILNSVTSFQPVTIEASSHRHPGPQPLIYPHTRHRPRSMVIQ